MTKYLVHVTIENKPGVSDPEGQTILNDLVLKGNYTSISKIRSGKMLKFHINEKSKKLAEQKAAKQALTRFNQEDSEEISSSMV